jgi:hypothetical protein
MICVAEWLRVARIQLGSLIGHSSMAFADASPGVTCNAGTGHTIFFLPCALVSRPVVKARSQGKVLSSSASLPAPRAVAPRIAFCDQEGPAIAPRYLTVAIASGAAVLTVDHEQKSFPEFCGNAREVGFPPRKPQRFDPPPLRTPDPIPVVGFLYLISQFCVRTPMTQLILKRASASRPSLVVPCLNALRGLVHARDLAGVRRFPEHREQAACGRRQCMCCLPRRERGRREGQARSV